MCINVVKVGGKLSPKSTGMLELDIAISLSSHRAFNSSSTLVSGSGLSNSSACLDKYGQVRTINGHLDKWTNLLFDAA